MKRFQHSADLVSRNSPFHVLQCEDFQREIRSIEADGLQCSLRFSNLSKTLFCAIYTHTELVFDGGVKSHRKLEDAPLFTLQTVRRKQNADQIKPTFIAHVTAESVL